MISRIYGHLPNGNPVHEYILKNAQGMCVSILDYGATITSIKTPDIRGNIDNVVLSYNSLTDYLKGTSYIGSVIGRVANRIENGRLFVNGRQYDLETNEGSNHLHGGVVGFDKKLWSAKVISTDDYEKISLFLKSLPGDQNYPGGVDVEVSYKLTSTNDLEVCYRALCFDSATPINMTQHSYFNLSGNCRERIYDHNLIINSKFYTPADKYNIPTGELCPVKDSYLDFENDRSLEMVLTSENLDLGGLDHNFVVNGSDNELNFVAKLYHKKSGRTLSVHSTQPCLQVYTGNHLDSDGADGGEFFRHSGICLECQGFPDSVNKNNFPSIMINPGDVYSEHTVYSFGVCETRD